MNRPYAHNRQRARALVRTIDTLPIATFTVAASLIFCLSLILRVLL
ncbi:hypothetical protein LJB81_02525 [Desulfovibrio sp. OttesenSCG-928-M14]|nr:hypothetical protein [Desulfovibrio sp. OttesenSCG-928-M14]